MEDGTEDVALNFGAEEDARTKLVRYVMGDNEGFLGHRVASLDNSVALFLHTPSPRSDIGVCYAIIIGGEMCGQTPLPPPFAKMESGKSWTHDVSDPVTKRRVSTLQSVLV